MESSANWEEEVTIQISTSLGITVTPLEFKGQFHAKVETQEVERRKKEHGNRLLMPNYHVEKSQKQIKCFFFTCNPILTKLCITLFCYKVPRKKVSQIHDD